MIGSSNFFLSIICSIDFPLRKLEKCLAKQHLTSPVLYPLCPGPFSMERTTTFARHGPKSSRSLQVCCGGKQENQGNQEN